MPQKSILSASILASCVGGLFVVGCELIAAVDRDDIPEPTGTTTATTTTTETTTTTAPVDGGQPDADDSGTGGTGGAGGQTGGGGQGGAGGQAGGGGGTGGHAGTGGQGGTAGGGGQGGGPECSVPSDCPFTDNGCQAPVCSAGKCDKQFAAEDVEAKQVVGDCKRALCDGKGDIKTTPDDTDLPDDGNDCTKDGCAAGSPTTLSSPSGTKCSQNGGKVCDGAGACVECIAGGDCATGVCDQDACKPLNGCSEAAIEDETASATVKVTFANVAYAPPCIKVKVGTQVTFEGTFSDHPLQGGTVEGGIATPAASGPFKTKTDTGQTKTFTMDAAGSFPYYCAKHYAMGMMGAVFVVP